MKLRAPNRVQDNAINRTFDEFYNTLNARTSIYDNLDCIVFPNQTFTLGEAKVFFHTRGLTARNFTIMPETDWPGRFVKTRVLEWDEKTAYIECDSTCTVSVVLWF